MRARSVFRELESQRLRDLPRDLVLDGHDIRESSVVLFTPNLCAVGYIDELGLDVQVLTPAHDASREHRTDTELTPDGARVDVFLAVAERGAARHDGELRKR